MKPQKQLLKFMLAKQKWLQELTKRKFIYINKKDIEEINSWPDNMAKRILKKIKKEKNQLYLDSTSCPFCYAYSSYLNISRRQCEICSYGINHGKCYRNNYKNPWAKFLNTRYVEKDTKIPPHVIKKLS